MFVRNVNFKACRAGEPTSISKYRKYVAKSVLSSVGHECDVSIRVQPDVLQAES